MERLGHRPALDGVRGLAIIAVVGRHFFNLPGGSLGVDVFFVLSGFLITTLLLEEHARDGAIALRAFYIRRGRRLLPALFIMLVLGALVMSTVLSPWHLAVVFGSPALYAANFVRAYTRPDLLTGGPTDHLWSLAEEEQFYLLWPVALIFLLRRRVRLVPALSALVVALVAYRFAWIAAGGGATRIHYSPDTHAEGLMLGCLLAALRSTGVRVPAAVGWPSVALLALIAVRPDSVPLAVELPLVELAAAGLIIAALEPGVLRRSLSLRPAVYLGTISYSVYVWHQFVHWMFLWHHPVWSAAVTLLVSVCSYHLIESRFRKPRSTGEEELRERLGAPPLYVSP